MWLVGRLVPDFKTIAVFRHDNASAIQIACQRFVAVCRALGLVGGGMVAIDGSRLRAVNTHEKNYTRGKLARRRPMSRRALHATSPSSKKPIARKQDQPHLASST
jgi:transposase